MTDSFNGQISDMTDTATDFPEGAFVPFIVEENQGGLLTSRNYRYDAGRYLAKYSTLAGTGSDEGDELIGSDDDASGSLWTTVKGFITYLRSSLGSSIVGFIQSGAGAIDEILQSVVRRTVWIESYGLSSSNTPAENAAAFLAAIDALPEWGGNLRYRGDYTTDTWRVPHSYIDGEKWRYYSIFGEGALTQGTPDEPIIAMEETVSRVIDMRIRGPILVPHASSEKANTANRLLDIAGFESCRIDVRHQNNPAATSTHGRAHAVVSGAAKSDAGEVPCYRNQIRLTLAEFSGPAKGVWLHNHGGTPLNNANINYVTIRAYAQSGCDVAVDCRDSTSTTIGFGLFEASAGMTGVLAGNFTVTKHNWFELGSDDPALVFGPITGGLANNCVSAYDYFSGAAKVVVYTTIDGPPHFDQSLLNAVSVVDENDDPSTNWTWQFGGTFTGSFRVTEDLTVDGTLYAGDTSSSTGAAHVVAKGTTLATKIVDFHFCGALFVGDTFTQSVVASCQQLGMNNSTGRSLNAAGTLNASGADYAEYMTKAEGCGSIAPGEVCGVTVGGTLTRAWAHAISYVVKSTDPAIVGADHWGQSVGPRPEQLEDESPEEFATRLASWEADLETARQKVDRISFSGQVPVAVNGDFTPGDYLVADDNEGGIRAVAVSDVDITFEQYRRRVGKVWAVLDDGRAWVDVQHA